MTDYARGLTHDDGQKPISIDSADFKTTSALFLLI